MQEKFIIMEQSLVDKFSFCPVCGSSNFMKETHKSHRCLDCGFEMFINSAASVVAIVLHEGKILLTRRAFEPKKGELDLPGGFVDAGESLEQALFREMKEETMLEIETFKWLFSFPNKYLYSGIEVPTTDNFFLCTVPDIQKLQPQDDVAELIWIPLKELKPQDMAFVSMQNAIKELQQRLL